jgi:hypothetical protein
MLLATLAPSPFSKRPITSWLCAVRRQSFVVRPCGALVQVNSPCRFAFFALRSEDGDRQADSEGNERLSHTTCAIVADLSMR